ncbi:hypothetical protein WN51_03485 [Melipona quadrifasciata]|uniref:Histone-lysine N-methyltransferase SETMAR n=1 Tax=Melipona quadrifasciata TaxID=166423 RepID=A0A0N0U465_9HYME|nr:hypothetical protein WN51_03485 [Melipona quadrifasciata]
MSEIKEEGLKFYYEREIVEKIEHDRHISSYDIGKVLNIDHKTVLNHLEKTEYKEKLDA